MNKEQILGRLLMNSYIDLNEFKILIAKDEEIIEACIDPNTSTFKKQEDDSGAYDWLDNFRKFVDVNSTKNF